MLAQALARAAAVRKARVFAAWEARSQDCAARRATIAQALAARTTASLRQSFHRHAQELRQADIGLRYRCGVCLRIMSCYSGMCHWLRFDD